MLLIELTNIGIEQIVVMLFPDCDLLLSYLYDTEVMVNRDEERMQLDGVD